MRTLGDKIASIIAAYNPDNISWIHDSTHQDATKLREALWALGWRCCS